MMDFSRVDAWAILEGAVKKVTNAAGTVLWELISWILGPEVYKTEESGCTAAITGASSYTFDEETGEITLGSKSSHTLASLYSSKTPVYTEVNGKVLTLKRVPSYVNSTAGGYYKEGSPTSSNAWNEAGTTISGYSSYSFNASTGKYAVSGSVSGKVEDLYSSGQKIYVSGGDTLVWCVVDDSMTTSSGGDSYSVSWGSSSIAAYVSIGNPHTLRKAYTGYTISGASIVLTGYVGDVTIEWDDDGTYYTGGGSSVTEYRCESGTTGTGTVYKRTGTLRNSEGSTSTSYRVTTYTNSSTYVSSGVGSYKEGTFGSSTTVENKQYTSLNTGPNAYSSYKLNASNGTFSGSGARSYLNYSYDYDNYQFYETGTKVGYTVSSDGKTLYKETVTASNVTNRITWRRQEMKATYVPVPLYKVETYTQTASEN